MRPLDMRLNIIRLVYCTIPTLNYFVLARTFSNKNQGELVIMPCLKYARGNMSPPNNAIDHCVQEVVEVTWCPYCPMG